MSGDVISQVARKVLDDSARTVYYVLTWKWDGGRYRIKAYVDDWVDDRKLIYETTITD